MSFNHMFARASITFIYQMHRGYLAAIPNSSKVIYFPGLERGKNEFLRKVKPVIKTLISSTRRVSTLS